MTMRRVAVALGAALALVVTAAGARAEESTLLGDLGDVDHGGYGGPTVRFTQIDGEFSVLSGGQGGWIINHRYVLGGGGFGLANPNRITAMDDDVLRSGKLEMGYGGGMIGVIVNSDGLIHAAVDLLIGAGGMTTQKHASDDVFFVLEPAAHAMLNVTDFFRFGVGASYRVVHGAGFGEVDDGDLDGLAWGFIFKFGSF